MKRKEDIYTVHYVPATEAQKQAFIKRLYEILFVEHPDAGGKLPPEKDGRKAESEKIELAGSL